MGKGGKARKAIIPPGVPSNDCSHNPLSQKELDSIFRNEAWIQRLARRLVADEARANELVQTVYAEALQKAPRNPRPWIALVLKRVSWRMKHSESRRKHREKAVAADRGEMQPAPNAPAEQADTKQKLQGFVGQLAEPYRSTLLLHFFEELDFAEIARRQGVPYSTVQTRVRRGVAQLREKLTLHYGDPSQWVFALAPIAGAIEIQSGDETGDLSPPKRGAWKALMGIAALFLVGGTILLTGIVGDSPQSEVGSLRSSTLPLDPYGERASEAASAEEESFRETQMPSEKFSLDGNSTGLNDATANPHESSGEKGGPMVFDRSTGESISVEERDKQAKKASSGGKKKAAANLKASMENPNPAPGAVLGNPGNSKSKKASLKELREH